MSIERALLAPAWLLPGSAHICETLANKALATIGAISLKTAGF